MRCGRRENAPLVFSASRYFLKEEATYAPEGYIRYALNSYGSRASTAGSTSRWRRRDGGPRGPSSSSFARRFNADLFLGVNYATLIFAQLCSPAQGAAAVQLPLQLVQPPREKPRISSRFSSPNAPSLARTFLPDAKYKDFGKLVPAISHYTARTGFLSLPLPAVPGFLSSFSGLGELFRRDNSRTDIKGRRIIAPACTVGS